MLAEINSFMAAMVADGIYIGGGVLFLILLVILVIWLFGRR